MIYPKTVVTPSNTPQGTPQRTVLKIAKGLVYFLELYYPSGSQGLLHVAIYDGGFQVWPTEHGSSFVGDDVHFFYDDLYIKEQPPFQFDILTWNDDDRYSHQVIVRIGLVTKDIFMSRFLPSMMYKEFEAVYTRILEEQQKRRMRVLKAPFFPIT